MTDTYLNPSGPNPNYEPNVVLDVYFNETNLTVDNQSVTVEIKPLNAVLEVSTKPVFAVGPRGYSAYELAVEEGFVGTIEDWLVDIGKKLEWGSTNW